MLKTARTKQPRRRVDGERGIALVAVLCLVSLLAVLAIGALEATRRHGQLAHRSFEIAQASELADSAIRVAIIEMTAPATQRAGSPLPNPLIVQIFGQPVAVRIEREIGRVDLNAAAETLLASTLAGKGVNANDARALAARIVDWRDADDVAGVQGAERPEYRRAGRSSGPRNAELETLSELRQVLGAEKLSDEVLDTFTVYSHAREVQNGAADAAQGFPEPGALAGEAVRLHACASVARSNICRTAIVRLTGNRAQPALIYAWGTRYAKK